MRLFRPLIGGLILLLCIQFSMPRFSFAANENPYDGVSDEELEEDHWETRSKNAVPGSVRCGLWAILLSTFWRGYGHHCAEDDDTHYKLLIMEGASVALMATALTIGSLTKDDKYLSPLWKTLFHAGTMLFISSYLFDIIGTFKGTAYPLADNHIDPFGHSVDLSLRWAPSESLDLGIELQYIYRTPRFWVKPYGFIDILSAKYWDAGVDLGVVLWKGELDYTYVALASDVKYEQDRRGQFDTITFLPYIELSLDLGSWFAHLTHLRFVNRLGFGANFYHFRSSGLRAFSDHSTLLVLESFLSLNVFKDFNLRMGYRQRPDFSIGPLSAPSRIFNTMAVPGFGVFSLDLSFHISSGWLTALEMNFGTSAEFWLHVNKRF